MGQQKPFSPAPDGFGQLAFSMRMKRLMQQVRVTPTAYSASIDEAKAVMAEARKTLPGLMSDAVLEKLLRHNPDLIQVVKGAGIPAGKIVFNGAMPLTEAGAAAIVSGQLDGANPDTSFIARADETPAAIYAALIFTPAAFGPAMKALTYYVGRIAPHGCPMFARAVTEHTRKLFPALGFMPAKSVYPGAPDDLLVVLPERRASSHLADGPESGRVKPIVIRPARSLDDLIKVISVRSATYMAEQTCPYEEEFDGNDLHGTHLLGEVAGEPAGCLRIRYFGEFVKFERLAVRHEFRKSKLAFKLVRAAIDHSRQKGFRWVYGHARKDLVRFWSSFGFRPLPDRREFTFSGQPYVEMGGPIAPHPNAITAETDPLRIIRPEGAWDVAGPLDLSCSRGVDADITDRIYAARRHADLRSAGEPLETAV